MRQIFYVSRAALGMNEATLRPILFISQQNNRRQDVTGCLMFSGQHFAQILEGDAGVLNELVRTISADRRHSNVVVLADRDSDTRLHPEWSMGFLYKLDLADKLEALLNGSNTAEEEIIELMTSIRTDSVMGPLM